MIKIILMIIILLLSIYIFYPPKKNIEIINYVYLNPKTKKYHLEKCPHAKGLKSIHLKIAVRNGYTPCKICNPKEVV